ncbi:MAG: FlgD immunoglobulin-like domain containing protein, partial [bacterium]
EPSCIEMNIYNASGRKIKTLVNQERDGGTHSFFWDGKDDSGNVVGSGIYFVHMKSGSYSETKKIAVIK